MPDKPVIANNTPLVALWVLGRLDLLRDLYSEVWIPQAIDGAVCPTWLANGKLL
jgi:predicted nucleic acid-binding protein